MGCHQSKDVETRKDIPLLIGSDDGSSLLQLQDFINIQRRTASNSVITAAATTIRTTRTRTRTMTSLPSVLKIKITEYLNAMDAVNLSLSCKTIHNDLSLSTLSPGILLVEKKGWGDDPFDNDHNNNNNNNNNDDDVAQVHRDPLCSFEIPIIYSPVKTHSIQVTCMWFDHGWGNRNGKIWIVAHSQTPATSRASPIMTPVEDDNHGGDLDFSKGRIVAEAHSIQKHERQKFNLSFRPKINEIYHLWYIVGGGAGHQFSHQLCIENLRVSTLVYDDERRTAKSAYTFARNIGVLDWICPTNKSITSPEMLLDALTDLREQIQNSSQDDVDDDDDDDRENKGNDSSTTGPGSTVAAADGEKVHEGKKKDEYIFTSDVVFQLHGLPPEAPYLLAAEELVATSINVGQSVRDWSRRR